MQFYSGAITLACIVVVLLLLLVALKMIFYCRSRCTPERKHERSFLPFVGRGYSMNPDILDAPLYPHSRLSIDNPCYQPFESSFRRKSEDVVLSPPPNSLAESAEVALSPKRLAQLQFIHEMLVTEN